MLDKDPVIETSDTLDGGVTFTSHTEEIHTPGDYISYIVGTVFANEEGTLKVQFDNGDDDWDAEETRDYTASEKLGFKIPITAPYFRIVYDNGSTNQGTFRLKVWESA